MGNHKNVGKVVSLFQYSLSYIYACDIKSYNRPHIALFLKGKVGWEGVGGRANGQVCPEWLWQTYYVD